MPADGQRNAGRDTRGRGRWRGLLLTGLLVASAGCDALYPNALRGTDGEPISFAAIREVLSDAELTVDEQRTGLRELGITDDALIDLLTRLD